MKFHNELDVQKFISSSNVNVESKGELLVNYPYMIKYASKNQRKELIKIIVSSSKSIDSNFLSFLTKDDLDEDIVSIMVDKVPEVFRYVQEFHTEDMCRNIVKKNGKMLEYSKHKTREICLEAILNEPFSLRFVPKDSSFYIELAELATKLNGDVIRIINIELQNDEMCMNALNTDPANIIFIKDPIKYSNQAVRMNPYMARDFPTLENCMTAVSIDGTIIANIPVEMRTEDVCKIAISSCKNIDIIDDIIPYIPMQIKDKLVDEFINNINQAAIMELGDKYYGCNFTTDPDSHHTDEDYI